MAIRATRWGRVTHVTLCVQRNEKRDKSSFSLYLISNLISHCDILDLHSANIHLPMYVKILREI